MDAARVYTKYVDARIRADRLNSLVGVRRKPLVRAKSRGRLPAGGRFSSSVASLGMPCIRIPFGKGGEEPDSDSCPCNDNEPVRPMKARDVKAKKTYNDKCVQPKKPTCWFECKCKNPVIVVPSKNRTKNWDNKVKKDIATVSRSPGWAHSSDCIERSPSSQNVESARGPSANKASYAQRRQPRDSLEIAGNTSSEVKARCLAKCTECEKIPDITQELCMLKQKLELQVAQEVKHKQELNVLNEQLKQICGTVKTLNEKCKVLETEKQNLAQERSTVKCECVKGASNKCVHHKLDIENKASSLCQFCMKKNLPIINSMHVPLFKMMERRCFQDIALTILLRADDIYHVNVRDLNTGAVLGCLLVTDAGIRESNCLGLFQEILTFCVIDVRSTINAKDAIFGCINFEFVQQPRLSGGKTLELSQAPPSLESEEPSLADAQLLSAPNTSEASLADAQLLPAPIITSVASKVEAHLLSAPKTSEARTDDDTSTERKKPKISRSLIMREIKTYSSNLVLQDTETKYSVRHVRIASQMDHSSSSEYSEDECSTSKLPTQLKSRPLLNMS